MEKMDENPTSFKQYCDDFHEMGFTNITERDISDLWWVVIDAPIDNDGMSNAQYHAIIAASTGPYIRDDEMSYRIIVAKYWTELKSWGQKWSPAVIKVLDAVTIVTDVKWVEPEPLTWGDYLAEL